ncbi:hypothetical protein CSA37_02975 [Candidatus Fermentibacteria bacterium]|nr:MAG: hypothetical protein CSA37_02975 [Candidatus Fermentibacteria bacterium]
MDLIKKEILGTRVLDAGCGKGRLASILSEDRSVTACDIVIDKKTIEQYPEISFHETDICSLPFSDKQFETVTCTHTLEHIWDIESAVKELRRVAEKRLIIVVPKERPYKYAFNLHLHFFTFPYQVIRMFSRDGNSANRRLEDLGNCWYCREDL